MGVKIELVGLDATIKGIKKYTEDVKKEVSKAIEESAINIEGHSKQRVPVDTGNLKKGITHKLSNDGLSAEIGTYDIEYAPYVEFGTSRMAAQPYLRPSLEEEIPNLSKAIEEALKK